MIAKRLALIAVMLVNIVAASLVFAPLVGAATVVVRPGALNGWSTISQRTATGSFVDGPATPPMPAPVGSFRATTGAGMGVGPDLPQGGAGQGGKTWLTTQQFDNTPLSAINELSYSTYIESSPSSPIVTSSLQLQIDVDNDGQRDAAMVFEPYYSTIANGGTQSNVTAGTWQTWDADAGKWWFTGGNLFPTPSTTFVINGRTYCRSDCFINFTDIQTDFQQAYPNAKIVTWYPLTDGYGVQFQTGMNGNGPPWANYVGNIDNFTFGVSSPSAASTTFNFEPLAICYVNDGPTGNNANVGDTAANPKLEIQACIDAVGTGGQVIVAAGEYDENIRITKPLTLTGPNTGVNPNGGTRGAEAIIVPNGNNYDGSSTAGAVVTLAANNITINGFTIDGDNPNVSGGTAMNLADVNAFYGITNDFTAGFVVVALAQNTTITNNIIKNLGEGVDLYATSSAASLGSQITNNSFDNMASRNESSRGIVLGDNFYATVTGNVMTRVYTGVQTNNFNRAGAPTTIGNNQIASYSTGIWHNLHYDTASTFTISGNTLTTADFTTWTGPGAITNENRNSGIFLSSIQIAVDVIVTNNNVSGANIGVEAWNLPTTAELTVDGGTLTGNNYGVRLNSCDSSFGRGGFPNLPTVLSVQNLTITGSPIAGLAVVDEPSANPSCPPTNLTTLIARNVIETGPDPDGTSSGALVDGPNARFSATESAFQGNQTGIKIVNGGQITAAGLHFNVIVANPAAGLDANGAIGTVNAENNWWGCNAGPNIGPGCDAALGAGVDASPWLLLRINRTPTGSTATAGQTFNVVADLIINSDAADTSAGGTVPDGTPIAFGVDPASGGSIAPTNGGTTNGALAAIFTAGSSGCTTISATSDDQTVTTPQLCVNTPPSPTPVASVAPTSLTFGNQAVGTTSASQPITLTNNGGAALTIGSIAASDDFSQTNDCPASLPASQSCTISVTFTPTATGGRDGTVTIFDNATGSPRFVTLGGTGVAATPSPSPVASVSPASRTFAGQVVGTTSASQPVTLSNTGGAPLAISSITTSGDFAQTNTCGTSLAAGASCTINVTFTPTVAGARSGTLSVFDNAAGSPQTVALSGTGTAAPPSPAPVASVAPASLTFNTQTVGTTGASQPVTLTNNGTAALTLNVVTVSGDFAQTNACPASLAAGASCTINVTFTPAVAGARAGVLSIFTNAPGSPQNVALNGAGIAPASPSPAPINYTVTVSQIGSGTVSPGTGVYTAGAQATFAATAAAGQVFLGWTLDGQYVGYASPLTFTVDGNRALVARFAARPTFADVPANDPDFQAITTLAALGIVNPAGVNNSGRFEPNREVARAEVAAFVARVFGWQREFHANSFPDRCDAQGQNCIDDELWNNVAALADYGVVGGYTDQATCASAGTEDPCYLPRDPVKRVQIVSIVARAFIKAPDLRPTGFWDRLDADLAQYTNVPDDGTQRSDLTTYRANAGPVPGTSADNATFTDPNGAASRRYIIQVLFGAYAAQYGVDRVP